MDSRRLYRVLQGNRFRKGISYNSILTFCPPYQLETDPELLIPKSRSALSRYRHQVVIGNDLHRRKFEVVFVSPSSDSKSLDDSQPSNFVETWIRIDLVKSPSKEIEEGIVEELVKRHQRWVQEARTP